MSNRKRGITRKQFDAIPGIVDGLQQKVDNLVADGCPSSSDGQRSTEMVFKHAPALIDKFGSAEVYAFALSYDRVEAAGKDLRGVTDDATAFEILSNHINPTTRN